MLMPEPVISSTLDTAEALAERYEHTTAKTRLAAAIRYLFRGRIALVSSFGADSAVLLHLVAEVDRDTPVIFVDTGMLFEETLSFRDKLVARLGLTNVTTYKPSEADLAVEDPENFLWASDPDKCCHIRKVLPLDRALDGYDAWISGRKRFQSETRDGLPIFEAQGGRTKVNPLADWSAKDLVAYIAEHDLPRNPLVAKNYLSIGCLPCTSPVRPGEDARAGRWRGRAKLECGIHKPFHEAGAGI
jgi:phosphoadenosine phosphosulfate reductase